MGDIKKSVDEIVESGGHIPNEENGILDDVLDNTKEKMEELNADSKNSND